MVTIEQQTPSNNLEKWDDIVASGRNPLDNVERLDTSTVPEEKLPIIATILEAEHQAIAIKDEQNQERQRVEDDTFRAELAAHNKALKEMSSVAVRGNLAAAINENSPSQQTTAPLVGTYHDGYLTQREHNDMIEARRNGNFD